MENMLSCPKVTCTSRRITVKKITVNYKDADYSKRTTVKFSKDAYNRFMPVFDEIMQHHEEFWVMYLGGGNRMQGMSCLSIGGCDGTIVDLRILFQAALLVNAKNIIVAHNHPNGTLYPSTHDEMITKKIADAGKILDIKLFDHIILNRESFFSFVDEGLLR